MEGKRKVIEFELWVSFYTRNKVILALYDQWMLKPMHTFLLYFLNHMEKKKKNYSIVKNQLYTYTKERRRRRWKRNGSRREMTNWTSLSVTKHTSLSSSSSSEDIVVHRIEKMYNAYDFHVCFLLFFPHSRKRNMIISDHCFYDNNNAFIFL